MLMRGWALTIVALGLLLATAPWATGDERQDRNAAAHSEAPWIGIYRLEHADSESVASAISKFAIAGRVFADTSTNSVIASANRAGHEQIERLLADLDVPPQRRQQATEFLPLKFRDAEVVARLIDDTATSHIKIAFDEATHAIIVTGRPSDIAAARDIVMRIDKPLRALTLSFYFVQGTIGNGSGKGVSALPPALKSVAPALSNSGFMNMSLLTPMTTAVQEGSEFTASGFLDTAAGDRLVFEIEGEVRESATTESAQFTLAARVARDLGNDEAIHVFGVETTLTTDLGHYVVLAAAPAQNGENQAMALIVRVD